MQQKINADHWVFVFDSHIYNGVKQSVVDRPGCLSKHFISYFFILIYTKLLTLAALALKT